MWAKAERVHVRLGYLLTDVVFLSDRSSPHPQARLGLGRAHREERFLAADEGLPRQFLLTRRIIGARRDFT